ncbi:MAG: TIGR00282 family metallophosphoesterase [bacterium]|nr:TIGR00282 family metallophosphoesterase [Candidatus Sumerlaeota bacterium]
MSASLRVLLVGDAMGKPGRQALQRILPEWRRTGRADFIIANGENLAGGKGITADTAAEIIEAGADVLTTGNHVWDNKGAFDVIGRDPRILRPANYPAGMDIPGCGHGLYAVHGMPLKIGVLNVLGRVLMPPIDCPFRAAREALPFLSNETPIIFVDFHAEATSEKIYMGWHLDGHVTCVFGTHTHVLTADERLLHKGTAYITDIGMTGGYDGVIGVKIESVTDKFLRLMPGRHEVCDRNVCMSGALVTLDPATGRALAIERVFEKAHL